MFGVQFYGRKNITAYPAVRAAFKRALFVSAGVAAGNIQIALPDQQDLCGVNTVNNGGYRRHLLLENNDSPGDGSGGDDGAGGVGGGDYEFSGDDALVTHMTESQRMQLMFGLSSYAEVQNAVMGFWSDEEKRAAGEKIRQKSLQEIPDTNVFFSIVNNVPGKYLQQ